MPVVAPSLRIDDLVVDESARVAVFRVYLSTPNWSQSVAVNYATDGGNATAGLDYTNTFGSLTFAPGVTEMFVTVPILDDVLSESAETFNVTLSGASNATIADSVATATITDNDNTPVPTVGNASVTEGGVMVHAVTLSAAATTPVVYTFSLAGGTATAGTDFSTTATFNNGVTLSAGHITIPAGVTSFTVSYATTSDTLDEANETTVLSICQKTGTGTIVDDDNCTLVVGNATAVEGTDLIHRVTLSNPSATATVYALTLTGTTATPGSDFGTALTFSNGVTMSAGQITVPAGVTSFTVKYPTVNDTLDEASETTALTVGGATGVGTILDNDAAPKLSVNDVTVDEADGLAVFTVSLSAASGQTVTVGYNTSNKTATAGSDYTSVTGTLTFAAGETTKTVTVPILNDTVDEVNERFHINLTAPTNATISDRLGVGLILDNDKPTIVSVSDATANEGSALVHTVTLSGPTAVAASYGFALTGVTATAGSDFSLTPTFSNGVTRGANGALTVPAGVTSFTVTVPTINDTIDEANETTRLHVGGVAGTGTILDNDNAPTIRSISSPTVTEGATLVHTVTLTNASASATTYAYSLSGVTATAGSDFNSSVTFNNGVSLAGGLLTVPAGVTSFTVSVPTINDTAIESTETTRLTIGGINGTGTILDNDLPPPSISVNDVAVNESAGVAVFTVSLSAASSQTVKVNYGTSNGSATAGNDYSSITGTVTFAAGQTSKTITVPIINDTVHENSETFNVNLSAATNATIADNKGVGTIIDNDPSGPPPGTATVTVGDRTGNEGEHIWHGVWLSQAAATATTYSFSITDGTAHTGHGNVVQVGQDGSYDVDLDQTRFTDGVTASGGYLTVPAGVSFFHVEVKANHDHNTSEGSETYRVNVGGDTGIGTILDGPSTPLVLDLNGDGVRSVGLSAGVNFDVDNTGFVRNTGWASAQDGLLVRDINRDGQINTGAELFGSGTSDGQGGKTNDGFQALALVDSNQDNVINSLDLGWKDLQVWRDANSDGVTDAGELLSMETAGVLSLNLAHTTSDKVENGNLHMLVGDYTTTSGETREMTDVFFGIGDRVSTEAVALHGQAATATGLTFDPTASVWQVGAEDGNVVLKGFDINHDVLDLRDLLGGQQGDSLDGLLSIKKEGSSTVLEVRDAAGADHAIVFAGVDLIGGNTDQQVIHDLLNNHRVVVD